MDIYTLIRNDHNDAKKIMDKIEKMPPDRHEEKLALFHHLREDLIAHNESEEHSFYAALRQHSETRADANQSEKEHHEAALMLDDLYDDEMEPNQWEDKFHKLRVALLQHIVKEEDKVFAAAQNVLTKETAHKLVHVMQDLKKRKRVLLKKAG